MYKKKTSQFRRYHLVRSIISIKSELNFSLYFPRPSEKRHLKFNFPSYLAEKKFFPHRWRQKANVYKFKTRLGIGMGKKNQSQKREKERERKRGSSKASSF